MIVIPASLRSDFIHIAGMTIHIALESTIHIVGIRIHRFPLFQGRIEACSTTRISNKRELHGVIPVA